MGRWGEIRSLFLHFSELFCSQNLDEFSSQKKKTKKICVIHLTYVFTGKSKVRGVSFMEVTDTYSRPPETFSPIVLFHLLFPGPLGVYVIENVTSRMHRMLRILPVLNYKKIYEIKNIFNTRINKKTLYCIVGILLTFKSARFSWLLHVLRVNIICLSYIVVVDEGEN